MPTMWYMEHMRRWIPLRHQTFNPFQLDQWKIQKSKLHNMIMIMYKFPALPQFMNRLVPVLFNVTNRRHNINRPKSSDWNQISKIHSNYLLVLNYNMIWYLRIWYLRTCNNNWTECNILGVNPAPENESEDTLSIKLISEVNFPPDYLQHLTTDERNSIDENTIDDYYEIEHAMGNHIFPIFIPLQFQNFLKTQN